MELHGPQLLQTQSTAGHSLSLQVPILLPEHSFPPNLAGISISLVRCPKPHDLLQAPHLPHLQLTCLSMLGWTIGHLLRLQDFVSLPIQFLPQRLAS